MLALALARGRPFGVEVGSSTSGGSGNVVKLLLRALKVEHVVQRLVLGVVRIFVVDEARLGIVVRPGQKHRLGVQSRPSAGLGLGLTLALAVMA